MSRIIRVFKHASSDYQKALALRDKVLRKPLGLQFTDAELEKDIDDTHLGLFEDEQIVACLILSKVSPDRTKMRQVAVDTGYQHKGLGTQLSHAAEKLAKESGAEVIYCHARKSAVPFYQKLGYQIIGQEFTEVNIPHYQMEKRL